MLVVLTACSAWDGLFGRAEQHGEPRVLWHVDGYSNDGLPFFDQNSVYFVGGHHDVTAVDKNSGIVRWSIVLPVDRPRTIGFGGFEHDGMLVVGDQDLFALDARDGRVVWRFASDSAIDIGLDVPEYWNGRIYTGSVNGYALCVDVVSGTQQWITRLSTHRHFRLWLGSLTGGIVWAGSTDFDDGAQGGVASLDATTGEVRWSATLPHDLDASAPTATIDPVATGTVVAVGARDGPIYAFDRDTGMPRWKAPALRELDATPPELFRDIRPLASSGSLVLAGSETGVLVALDAETGVERWRTGTAERATIAWLWADEASAYAIMAVAGIHVFSVSAGVERWQLDSGRYFFEYGVGIDSDRVYVGSIRGLYALRKD